MGAFHARNVPLGPTIEIVAIADVDTTAAEALAAEIDAPAVVSSPRELLEVEAVDGWLVASPTPTHPEIVRTALESGIHVLCEKPLALDPPQGEELELLAREAGMVLQVGFWRRFSPPWVRAKELLDAGAIGKPLFLRLAQWDAYPPPAAFCDPAVSGGLAVDCGVHEFDLVEWLTGRHIQQVDGRALPIVDRDLGLVGDVDNLVALLDLDDGSVAEVDLSRNARYGDDVRTEILGSEGALFVDMLPRGVTRHGSADGLRTVSGSQVEDVMGAGVAEQARAFAGAIRGGEMSIPGAAASNRAVRIGRAVQEAVRRGARVAIDQDGR